MWHWSGLGILQGIPEGRVASRSSTNSPARRERGNGDGSFGGDGGSGGPGPAAILGSSRRLLPPKPSTRGALDSQGDLAPLRRTTGGESRPRVHRRGAVAVVGVSGRCQDAGKTPGPFGRDAHTDPARARRQRVALLCAFPPAPTPGSTPLCLSIPTCSWTMHPGAGPSPPPAPCLSFPLLSGAKGDPQARTRHCLD